MADGRGGNVDYKLDDVVDCVLDDDDDDDDDHDDNDDDDGGDDDDVDDDDNIGVDDVVD